jgi:hypothetical protein
VLFPGCFAAVGDFVLVLGVFPGYFAVAWDFILDLWLFPGHFLFAVAVCPGFGAISGMFCCGDVFCP